MNPRNYLEWHSGFRPSWRPAGRWAGGFRSRGLP